MNSKNSFQQFDGPIIENNKYNEYNNNLVFQPHKNKISNENGDENGGGGDKEM